MNSTLLYLSSRGDSFNLKLRGNNNFRDVDFQTDNVHPYLKKAAECKTHQAVLEFLKGIKGDEQCELYHSHNPKYPSHSLNVGFGMVKGAAHKCPVEKMISFVELRIKEKNSPHAFFDKIGKVLGRSFHYLSLGTSLPFLGIIPGAGRVIIGLGQIIGGFALAIIFAIPAYCFKSENAQIIVQRSVKHLGYGPLNIGIGILQGTPFLGTWIYFKLTRAY